MLYLFLKGDAAVFYGGFTNYKDLKEKVNELVEHEPEDFYYLDGRGNMRDVK